MTVQISLEDRYPGHAGALTAAETQKLKRLWIDLFQLFEQPGEPYTPTPTREQNKGGWFRNKQPTDLFIGATTDPQWMSLPLESAIRLIPGSMLKKAFWGLVGVENPDASLLRFLRARKWDYDATYNMVINTLRWRLYMRVDDMVALGEMGLHDELERLQPGLGEQFIRQIKIKKGTVGGPDKKGRGVCFMHASLHYKEDQTHEVVKIGTIYMMEIGRLACAYPRETVCILFNLENFTLANMDYDFVKFLLTCLQSYYPETLGSCLLHGAPWIFSTVWSIISPWIDPVVATKIHFTKNLEDLQKYIDIGQLPVIISGNPDRLTKLEAAKEAHPIPGTLETPTTEAYMEYQTFLTKYEADTVAWAKTGTKDDEKQDALSRLELALEFRRKRIATEPDLRASNTTLEAGLIVMEKGRLYVDYGGSHAKKDITDCV